MSDEKLKVWLDFMKFVVGTCIIGVVSTLINHQIQTRRVEIEETKQLGAFLEQALAENVGTRRRFAEYFATVTRSDEMRDRWDQYKKMVEEEFAMVKKESEQLKRLAKEAEKKVQAVNPENSLEAAEARTELAQAKIELQKKESELTFGAKLQETSVETGSCKLGESTRIIEIVEDQTKCEVYYTKNDGLRVRKYLYRHEREKCKEGAENILKNLENAGFQCSVDWRDI